jgi:uncharacterized protein YndB with AHSA1/START domain
MTVERTSVGDKLVQVREFDAPVELVWRAWTESELVKRWWGPDRFSCPVARMDVRPGGVSVVAMRSPDGRDMYSTWTYREVVRHERLVWVHELSDEQGRPVEPAAQGLPDEFPRHVLHTVVFEVLPGGRTRVTVTEQGHTSPMFLGSARMGLAECLDKMERSLTS